MTCAHFLSHETRGRGPLTVGGPGSLNLLNPLLLRHCSALFLLPLHLSLPISVAASPLISVLDFINLTEPPQCIAGFERLTLWTREPVYRFERLCPYPEKSVYRFDCLCMYVCAGMQLNSYGATGAKRLTPRGSWIRNIYFRGSRGMLSIPMRSPYFMLSRITHQCAS